MQIGGLKVAKEGDQEPSRGAKRPQEGPRGPQSGGERIKNGPNMFPRGIEKSIRIERAKNLENDDHLKENA